MLATIVLAVLTRGLVRAGGGQLAGLVLTAVVGVGAVIGTVLALVLTALAVAIGVVASGPEAASGFTFIILFIPYVSSAFVPPESMPSVLQTIATYNPITPLSDTVRGLLLGQPVGDSWPAAVLWCLGIFVVGRLAAGLLFRRSR